jgi:flagellar biogenesis protein FliO
MSAPLSPGVLPDGLVALVSLGAVLLLILGLSWLAKQVPRWNVAAPANVAAPVLLGSLALDARRRLHLVEVQGARALVLTGGVTDIIVCLPHTVS